MYTVKETDDVLCVELDTPEKTQDSKDIIKLGGDSQVSRRVVKGDQSVESGREAKGDHSRKGKKRKRTYDDEEEGTGPKLTSKQVRQNCRSVFHDCMLLWTVSACCCA